MSPDLLPLLLLGILVIAFLYSSVGHAGASGYIAVMSLLGLAPAVVKPTALVLNIFVASIGTWQFYRAGYFRWTIFWPFAVTSVPLAFLGGYINPPPQVFRLLVGLVLFASAAHLFLRPGGDPEPVAPGRSVALLTGGGLGFLAGLTGTGGGIFLTPLLIFKRWARAKNAAAVSALFILLNSVAGLLGNLGATRTFPSFAVLLLVAAVLGGAAGSYLGSRRLPPVATKRLLAAVLAIAAFKLVFT